MGSVTHFLVPLIAIIAIILYHVPPPSPLPSSSPICTPKTYPSKPILSSSDKKYDIVVMGATGVTGKQVTRYLDDRGVNFAIAGRNMEKLKKVKVRAKAGERSEP